METKNILEVENFVIECNDILTGKFFDLSRRLEKFLNVMTQSEDVLELLADSLVDFDEAEEFSKAFSFDRKTGAVKISLPTDDKKRLALSVTLFNDIVNEKLNANQFLETFFQGNKNTSIQNFLDKVIRPFRDILCKIFEVPTTISVLDLKKHEQELKLAQEQKNAEELEELEEEKEEEFPHLSELMQEIKKSCGQILALISFERKHDDMLDDVEFVTNGIAKACDDGDLMIVNALVIGLSYVAKKFKNARHIIEDMKTLILNYYDFLANPEDLEDDEQAQDAGDEFDDFGGQDG